MLLGDVPEGGLYTVLEVALEFDERVVVGGAGRLGKVFIQRCKSKNMTVFVMDICDQETWHKLNINCDLYVQTDINNLNSLSGSIKQITEHIDHIDCVVNTSYPRNKTFGKAVFDISLKNFNENINLHLGGYFHVMQKFTELFIQQGYGNIINIASAP